MFYSNDITFYIISLGCSKNLVDSERINGAMVNSGFIPVTSSVDADILIINTCGFITPAKEESIDVILDGASQMSDEPNHIKPFSQNGIAESKEFKRKLVVVGCLTERYFDQIQDEISEIDLIYKIPDDSFVEILAGEFLITLQKKHGTGRMPLLENLSYSYIKIAEGCSNNCSYCAIPLIRGNHESFPVETILEDVKTSVSQGAVEMTIVGQDIASYTWNNFKLPQLIDSISEVEGVSWIRLLYCHPDHIDDTIIDCINQNKKVVPYIDIPFQHVNKSILSSMGRKGDYGTYLELIERLRRRVPNIRIRSTFMVGYPGEGDAEYSELMKFISEAQIDKVGAFSYSPEEGTSASKLQDDVPEAVKNERYNGLMELQQKISEEKLHQLVGKEIHVVVEEKLEDNIYLCRSEYDAPEVDGFFYLTAQMAPLKSIIPVRVTDSTEYDLIGAPL